MTLGWSRVMFLTFMVNTDITAFLRGHLAAFHYLRRAAQDAARQS
jgi:hypothetical protein